MAKLCLGKISFVLILLIAALLRFNNLNWDSGFHLHPDERFLTMVGNAMVIPQTVNEYFDPSVSMLNPANIGYKFFVYGVLPLTLNKGLAVWLNTDTYNDYTVQGRMLSGIFDIFTLIILFQFVRLLEERFKLSKKLKYWTAFFYAIAVLPIQLSHFFAVDTFLSFFMLGSFYFSFKYYLHHKKMDVFISAVLFGLALATKINAVYILPLNMFFIALAFFSVNKDHHKNVLKVLIYGMAYAVLSYITLRFANPYYFQSPNFFDPQFSRVFIENIRSLKSFEGPDVWFPPAIQWINTPPVWFSVKNLALYGVGIPYFIFLVIGFVAVFKLHKGHIYKVTLGLITAWVIGLFLYQSVQFVKALRYFIFLYPFFAFFAAVGFYYVKSKIVEFKPMNVFLQYSIYAVLLISVIVWPMAFSYIYTQPHSRVAASEWMYKNIQSDSVLLTEHWDDGLPLPMPNPEQRIFTSKEMPVFGMDNAEKWEQIASLMAEGDYYVLSSNRGWGSMPTVPEKYPQMGQFYKDLFEGKLGYEKVAEFTSYPKIKILNFEFAFPDDNADETFTVYDHPKVMIFKNTTKDR